MIATELSKITKVSEIPEISQIIQKQRLFFAGGKTKSINFRIEQLRKLKQVLVEHKAAIIQALQADLSKPEFESYISEIYVIKEIEHAIKNIRSWTKPKKAKCPSDVFNYSAKIYPEPLGLALIIGAWNYPIQLVISPLIGAITAGNCAILKPFRICSSYLKYTG